LFSGGKLCELTFSDVREEIRRAGLIPVEVSTTPS